MLYDFLQNKFIIQDNEVVIGRARFHNELAERGLVRGTGRYHIDLNTREITFCGVRQELCKEELQDAVKSGNVRLRKGGIKYCSVFKMFYLEGQSYNPLHDKKYREELENPNYIGV